MPKRVKMQTGRVPPLGAEIARAEFDGDEAWALYLMPSPPTHANLKLAAIGRAERKANYWLAWDRRRSRFVASSDIGKLAEYRPVLYQWLRELCGDPKIEPEDYIMAEPLDFDALIAKHDKAIDSPTDRYKAIRDAEAGAADDFSDLIGG